VKIERINAPSASCWSLAGHLFLALVWRPTGPALRGMVRGTVDAAWAARHHERWRPEASHGAASDQLSAGRAVAAVVVMALGVAATIALVADVLDAA
jgi:cytochrome b subunit of formate dehydrogenase